MLGEKGVGGDRGEGEVVSRRGKRRRKNRTGERDREYRIQMKHMVI